MYGETVQNRPSAYLGCGTEYADGYDNVLAYFNKCHKEAVKIFGRLTPKQLKGKSITPGGASITTWKWLRAMIEHEIHHRGQIYLYLAILEIPTPPLYGLTAEQVEERGKSSNNFVKQESSTSCC